MSRPADKVRDEKIRAEFNGRNYHVLARRYGLSARHIRRIVDGQRSQPCPAQKSASKK